MRAILHANRSDHQISARQWMAEGLRRHGVETVFADAGEIPSGDLVVMWSWRRRAVIDAAKASGTPVLVMERGSIPPRLDWVSCGFNGLGGRGIYPAVSDAGQRWEKYFAGRIKPWRTGGNYALVCGQPGIADEHALHGTEIHEWAQAAIDKMQAQGEKVRYRPHPDAAMLGDHWLPQNAEISTSGFEDDLGGASRVIVYSSSAATEAVLAGVPAVTCDPGAMAWPVTSHDVTAPPAMPDRANWCHSLAWTQWTPEHIRLGIAWEHLQPLTVSGRL